MIMTLTSSTLQIQRHEYSGDSGCKWFGQNQRNRKFKPNQTEKYPTLFGSVWNRSEQIETDLVWFGSWFFISRSVKPINQFDDNHTPYFTNIILPHTNLWLGPKLNKILFNPLIFSHLHLISSVDDSRWNLIDLVWMFLFNFMTFKFQNVLISICMEIYAPERTHRHPKHGPYATRNSMHPMHALGSPRNPKLNRYTPTGDMILFSFIFKCRFGISTPK